MGNYGDFAESWESADPVVQLASFAFLDTLFKYLKQCQLREKKDKLNSLIETTS